MLNSETILLVLTNMPDEASAKQLAETLITQKLAACINLLSPCQSIYAWQGKIEHVREVPMLIKTNQAQYDALEAAIIKAHPYELPEIISIHVDGGLPRYLQWVNAQLFI
ncbi:MAG: divalent-cation tolerance protein CutA [Methylotenera sp.]|nr:divalent-cation tolerance protein CutA [Methylotenera sp.]